ncbi:MAG: Fic family protein [Fibrobacter sp.]|nr:Fic family protein [Fibrobacter sp.]
MATEISALVERFVIRLEQTDGLKLRKANKIKSIHSSLAIEGNSLSEEVVSDIINGKRVLAPPREILEVKNALATYELYPKLNPFSLEDLLKAHGVMMQGIKPDAGKFRNCNEGVFSGSKCIHLAPPPDRVPALMEDLFDWLKNSKDHLLVRSCVFHYEFEFIHPFSDGNGRTGRLWQSLILGKLNPSFEFLPVENMVYANQRKYYDAIAKSTKAGESTPFVEFMLQNILATLKKYKNTTLASAGSTNNVKLTSRQQKIVELIQNGDATTESLAKKFKVSARTIARDLATLQENEIIVRDGSRKTGRWLVK